MIIKYADGETMELGKSIPPKTWAETRAEKLLHPLGYRLSDGSRDTGDTIARMARKQYGCWGGHDGEKRTRCAVPINAGDVHIEYIGESPLYSSGHRYHLECACQQGLIKRVSDATAIPKK